jgi:lipopolysaccharide export LptBFGC system permease protein LptF
MTIPPPPPPNYPRVALVGALLSVLGIGLFVLLWVVLGSAGVANAPRLFAAMCIPPLVIGVIVGAYALYMRSHGISQIVETPPEDPPAPAP